jgi:hypothetical protein
VVPLPLLPAVPPPAIPLVPPVPLVELAVLPDVPAPDVVVPVPLVPDVLVLSSRPHAVVDNARAMPTANQICLLMLSPLCR